MCAHVQNSTNKKLIKGTVLHVEMRNRVKSLGHDVVLSEIEPVICLYIFQPPTPFLENVGNVTNWNFS